MEDPPLERRQVVLDHALALRESPARIDGAVGRCLPRGKFACVVAVERLDLGPNAAETAVYRVPGDPEDPHEQRRVALEAPERVEDGEEHLLGDVLGLGGVSQALQREAVDAREVGLVEEFEMSRAALEDLLDELPVVGPGLLTMRHVLALLRSPRRSRS